MTADDRIIELLTDSLKTQDKILIRLGSMENRLESMDSRLERVENRLERVEAAQHETNLILQEHSRAILQLADKIEGEVVHRISRLEDAVFHV